MSWIFSKYISKNFIFIFLATLFSLIALIGLFDIIDLLRRASSRDYVGFFDIVRLACYKVPQLLPLILPFSVLLASVICFLKLSKTNELVIARASGLSVWNFLSPVFLIVFLIGFLNISVINPFTAVMIRRYRTMESITLRKNTNFSWNDKGLWLREKMGENPVIIHADSVFQENKDLHLKDIIILVLNTDETLNRQLESQQGLLTNKTLLIPTALSYTPDGIKQEETDIQIPTQLSLDKIIQTFDTPEEISIWHLPSFIRLLTKAGFSATKHKVHFFSTLSSVFYLIAMVFIASLFTLSPNQRQGGTLFKSTQAILLGFVLFFVSKLTLAVGSSGHLPILLASFAPSLIMIFIAISVLLHSEDG